MLMNVLIILVGLVLSAYMMATLGALFRKVKRQKKAQDEIVSRLASLGVGQADSWYRIKFSRPAYHARRFTWTTWTGCEAQGVLINEPLQVRVIGKLDSGEQVDWRYPKNALALQWLGCVGLRSANMYWFALEAGEQRLMVTADTGMEVLRSREATADLCRVIAPDFALPDIAKAEFALEKNPATLTAIIILLALLAFAVLDGIIFNGNELLGTKHVFRAVPYLCLIALPLVYWLLSRRAVPWRESIAVASLVSLALTVAHLPALKRIDQFLATDGPRLYAYRLGDDALFTPLAEGPPEFRGDKRDWSAFQIGTTHEFALLHGPLGLWQLDAASFDEKLRAAKAKNGAE